MTVLGVEFVDIDIPKTLGALALLLTAIGVPALLQSRRTRGRTKEVERQVTPLNGRTDPEADPTLASLIERTHAIAEQSYRLAVAIDGRTHDLSKRADGIDRDVAEIKATSHQVADLLQAHLDEVAPMVEEAKDTRERVIALEDKED